MQTTLCIISLCEQTVLGPAAGAGFLWFGIQPRGAAFLTSARVARCLKVTI